MLPGSYCLMDKTWDMLTRSDLTGCAHTKEDRWFLKQLDPMVYRVLKDS